jgi:hypothetical protein
MAVREKAKFCRIAEGLPVILILDRPQDRETFGELEALEFFAGDIRPDSKARPNAR